MEDGAVTDDMLVWNRTMKNWQRLADVKLDGGGTEQRPCGECGEHFAENRLLQHGDELVCDSCKLKLLKEKREGEDEEVFENIDLNYAGIFSRFVAKIVDFIIMFLIAFGTEFSARIVFSEYFATATLSSAFMVTLFINMVLGILYITWFVGRFGATPGKMLFHMKIVNGDGSRIGYGQAFARYCGEFVVASLTFSIGYLMAAVDSEHRALHDRICNTRVVAA